MQYILFLNINYNLQSFDIFSDHLLTMQILNQVNLLLQLLCVLFSCYLAKNKNQVHPTNSRQATYQIPKQDFYYVAKRMYRYNFNVRSTNFFNFCSLCLEFIP